MPPPELAYYRMPLMATIAKEYYIVTLNATGRQKLEDLGLMELLISYIFIDITHRYIKLNHLFSLVSKLKDTKKGQIVI